MTENAPDPLLLGQRVVAILETGLRTATYKLATLTTDAPQYEHRRAEEETLGELKAGELHLLSRF